jgi:hypothetical protein
LQQVSRAIPFIGNYLRDHFTRKGAQAIINILQYPGTKINMDAVVRAIEDALKD